jgi:hypothetical protein
MRGGASVLSSVFRSGEQQQREIGMAMALLRNALAGVPTTLGKLAWISAFRVPGSDQYSHPTLDGVVPHDVAVRASHSVHSCLFADWLSMGLEEQHKDLAEYLAVRKAGDPRPYLKNDWERLIPPSAGGADRLLFETDLSIVLGLAED